MNRQKRIELYTERASKHLDLFTGEPVPLEKRRTGGGKPVPRKKHKLFCNLHWTDDEMVCFRAFECFWALAIYKEPMKRFIDSLEDSMPKNIVKPELVAEARTLISDGLMLKRNTENEKTEP